MSNILITGSSYGLGKLLAEVLAHQGHTIFGFDRIDGYDVRRPVLPHFGGCTIDVLINNAGVNRINWLQRFEESDWDEVMDTNAKGIYMMTRALLPHLIESKGTVLNIVSNASHVPMRCSLAYNASKGAAHIMTLQLARELSTLYGITVFGVSPNRLRGTEMSSGIDQQVMQTRGWSRDETEAYQRQSLLAREETPPTHVANFIAYLLQTKDHHRYLTGCVLPYGA